MKPTTQPPRSVPVLTEVVVLPKVAPVEEVDEFPPLHGAADPAYAATAPAPMGGAEYPSAVAPPASAAPKSTAVQPLRPVPASVAPTGAEATGSAEASNIDEARIAQRVLADLEKQLDLMFEHRLRESLAPVLARLTDSLVREMRNQLAANMRDMVTRAVSLELDRLQKR